MADEGLHVVVTIADNGVVHAWGEGPVVDPGHTVRPFATRTRARAVAAQFRREERRKWLEEGEEIRVKVKVCKVLGIEPVAVEAKARTK
jgi:hypothetical protein